MRGPPPRMPPTKYAHTSVYPENKGGLRRTQTPFPRPETLYILRDKGLAFPRCGPGTVLEGTALPAPRAAWPGWNSCAEGRCCWGEGWAQRAPALQSRAAGCPAPRGLQVYEEPESAPTLREEGISTCSPGHQATACPCVCASELISSPPGCSGRAEWYSGAVVRSDNRCSDQELGTPHQQL